LAGWDGAEAMLNTSFWRIATKSANSTSHPPPSLQFCRLATNQSICEPLQKMANFSVVLFNGLSRSADSIAVRIPFYRKMAKVFDGKGNEVPSAVVKTFIGGNEQQMKGVEVN
jgi:hypothetical protein